MQQVRIMLRKNFIKKHAIVIRKSMDDISGCIDDMNRRREINKAIENLMKECEYLNYLADFSQNKQ